MNETPPFLPGPSNDELIGTAYSVITDPENFGELLFVWSKQVSAALDQKNDPINQTNLAIDPILVEHFERAFTVLNTLPASKTMDTPEFEKLLHSQNGPAALVRRDGTLFAANHMAKARLGEKLDQPMDMPVHRIIAQAQIKEGAKSALMTAFDHDENEIILILRLLPKSAIGPLYLLTLVEIKLTPELTELLASGFGLTTAECEIATQIARGQTLKEIAANRGNSINTTRSQLAAVLAKTATNSQSDLVRLLIGISNVVETLKIADQPAHWQAHTSEQHAMGTEHTLPRPDGRDLSYFLIGPKDGQMVGFMHGVVDGPFVPRVVLQRLHHHNICLFAPARPGFGNTSAAGKGQSIPATIRDDFCALMDHLNVPKCLLIGYKMGGTRAIVLGRHLPGRICAVISLGTGIPVITKEQIHGAPLGLRSFYLAARFAPNVLPLLVRAALTLMEKGKISSFYEALYGDAGKDPELVKDPQIEKIMTMGTRFANAQGYAGIADDCVHQARDWSADIQQCAPPVTLIQGKDDSLIQWRFMEHFAETNPKINVICIENAGQTMLHTHGAQIIDMIAEQVFRYTPDK